MKYSTESQLKLQSLANIFYKFTAVASDVHGT